MRKKWENEGEKNFFHTWSARSIRHDGRVEKIFLINSLHCLRDYELAFLSSYSPWLWKSARSGKISNWVVHRSSQSHTEKPNEILKYSIFTQTEKLTIFHFLKWLAYSFTDIIMTCVCGIESLFVYRKLSQKKQNFWMSTLPMVDLSWIFELLSRITYLYGFLDIRPTCEGQLLI